MIHKVFYNDKPFHYIERDYSIMVDVHEAANILRLQDPRKEVVKIKLNEKFDTKMEGVGENTHIFGDYSFIIELAFRADSLTSREFLEWLMYLSSSTLVESMMRSQGGNNDVLSIDLESNNNNSFFTTTQIAKKFGMSAVMLNSILHKARIQYKVNEQWVLYDKYQDLGYTHTMMFEKRSKREYVYHTYWTLKGQDFVERFLLEHGYNQQIEAEIT